MHTLRKILSRGNLLGSRRRDASAEGVDQFEIPTIGVVKIDGDKIKQAPVKSSYGTSGIGFDIYSFGIQPTQRVQQFPKSNYQSTPDANCALPEAGASETRENGGVVVGVAGLGFSKQKLVSHSFSPCTPIAAFYRDGNMGLYHASSAAEDDEMRQALLSANPSDIFVITKPGEGPHKARQNAHARHIIGNAPPYCNVHIVEVPRNTLAVEMTPRKLDIYQMD